MLRILRSAILTTALMGASVSSFGFSMLGPFDTWQVVRIGYLPDLNADLGGPMDLGEEYRWNIRTITYGFDPSFLDYFGQRGVEEVRKAIGIMNALPPVSKMSADLSEFPLDSRRVNYEASALFMQDLKSTTLGVLMEEVGLTSPERYAWTLRAREENPVRYWVIKRNFDPVTWQPTPYVNGTLYTYGIFEFGGPDWADAVEYQVDPVAPSFTAVASIVSFLHEGFLRPGEYVTGLTRDDVGGLRYIYRPNNYNVEGAIPGTEVTSGGPLAPAVVGTNGVNTNGVVNALRPGVDKLTFVEAKFASSGFGNFIPITNRYVDYFITNNTLVKQFTQRAQFFTPDILFSAADLGPGVAIARTDTGGWTNNTAINGSPAAPALAGPGTINPTVVITFGKVVEFNFHQSPFIFEPERLGFGLAWGAFDGTTNKPFLFPQGANIEALEQRVLGR